MLPKGRLAPKYQVPVSTPISQLFCCHLQMLLFTKQLLSENPWTHPPTHTIQMLSRPHSLPADPGACHLQ